MKRCIKIIHKERKKKFTSHKQSLVKELIKFFYKCLTQHKEILFWKNLKTKRHNLSYKDRNGNEFPF